MTAQVVSFPAAQTSPVEMAWATHRAFVRAEVADPSLLKCGAHIAGREQAKANFLRLFDDWCKP